MSASSTKAQTTTRKNGKSKKPMGCGQTATVATRIGAAHQPERPRSCSRFESTQGRFWNTNVQILGYEKVRQIAFSPWAKGTVPRRFCSAVADVSTGRKHVVNYYITEDGGMIGATWGVTYCVVGFDRNMAYSPACKMARP